MYPVHIKDSKGFEQLINFVLSNFNFKIIKRRNYFFKKKCVFRNKDIVFTLIHDCHGNHFHANDVLAEICIQKIGDLIDKLRLKGVDDPQNKLENLEIVWDELPNSEFPYQSVLDGQKFRIRVNDFPAEPLYSLLIDETCIFDFDVWPKNWLKRQEAIKVYFIKDHLCIVNNFGVIKKYSFDSISRIEIETNDRGPFEEDVFFLVRVHNSEIKIPQSIMEMDFVKQLIERPSFNYENLINAMSCGKNKRFLCWENIVNLSE